MTTEYKSKCCGADIMLKHNIDKANNVEHITRCADCRGICDIVKADDEVKPEPSLPAVTNCFGLVIELDGALKAFNFRSNRGLRGVDNLHYTADSIVCTYDHAGLQYQIEIKAVKKAGNHVGV